VLNRAQKEEQVADFKDKFGRATSVFVADYRGLTVKQSSELRQELRGDAPEESEFLIAKNSLLKLAAADSDLSSISEHFRGPTAIAVSYGDPVRVAKVLVDFQKKNDAFEVKGGYLDGSALGADEVATLATLPSLLELRAQMAGLIQAPATKLVRLLNEPGSQLARLVGARRSALEEGGES
jgi:large subunit ribosomal protein L10